MGHPSKVCVNTTEKGHLLKHIFLPAPSDSVITRQERKVKASVDEKMQVFCLTTTIYFQFLLSARTEWAGRGLEAGGRGRPLGSGRGPTLVTSGYDRIIMIIIIINIVIPLQQVFILPTTATEEASWWRNICAFISLYTHLLLQFTLPAGDRVGRGGGLPSWAGGNDIYHHHDHHEHFTTAGRCG